MTLEVVSPTAALLDSRYLLEEPVGKGGMATVYRAEDTHLGRTVAIKMIHDGGGDAESSVDRAHTEKALLASLNHPSLVTLFDARLERTGAQYLVMEYIDGPTLAARMAEGPIPPPQLARITRDLAKGLDAAHAAGIIHRDVKPSNVLMAPTGDPGMPWAAKLADFGIACSVERSPMTSPGIVLGTLMYMAPEQLSDSDPGTAVDVFSLGLVVLEALTGEPGYPAVGSDRRAAVMRLSVPPTIPDTVDAEWRDLLERMTRIDPAERPTAAEVARAARALAKRSGTAPYAATVPAPAPHTDGPGTTHDRKAPPTAPTTVLPPAAADSRVRRRIGLGAALVAVLAIATAGTAALTEPATDFPRVASVTSLRSADASTEPPAPVEEAPAQVVTEPTDDNSGQGNQGKGDDGQGNQGNQGKGNNNGNDKGNGKGKDK
ncbi:protein kinase [Microbacterium sp. NPDC056234]|uniref:serine/threonine-protein kinase n=1 Tax=Microbacterium sp. NPDC056234 TaxID=3345757 RepID=UPI0035E1DB56